MNSHHSCAKPSSSWYKTATVRIPTKLLALSALDRGIYAMATRQLPLARDPETGTPLGHLPLSATDIGRYDPTVTYGAARRSLERLVATGFLVPQSTPGHKNDYQPTWDSHTDPIDLTKPNYGKPPSCAIIPLPAALLDHFLGIITLDPVAPASIRRYTTTPLLRLTDIGVYIAALHGQPVTTTSLERYGLIQDGQVCALPDLTTTLARATQVPLEEPISITLTPAGSAKLGLCVTPPPPQPATTTGQPLFFVAPGVIGGVIDQLIATGCPCHVASIPSACENRPPTLTDQSSPWSAWTHESIKHESPDQRKSHAGGGTVVDDSLNQPASPPHAMPTPLPESFRRELDITHKHLNPDRPILPGEWLELATLVQEHGVSALLIWQSRAMCAGRTRITPSYYRACAAQAALATYRPPRSTVPQTLVTDLPVPAAPPRAPVVLDQPAATVPDAGVIAQLEAAAGEPVRCPQLLAGVAPALITAWTQVVGHAGLRARFADPLGFALTQLRRGMPPPPSARLDAWSASTPASPTPWTVDDLTTFHQDYGDLFRLGSGQSLPQHQVPVLPSRPHRPIDTHLVTAHHLPDRVPFPSTPPPSCTYAVHAIPPSPPTGTPPPQMDSMALLKAIQSAVRLRAGRGPLRSLLDTVTLDLRQDALLITCRSAAHLSQVQTLLLPMLPTVLAECGVSVRVQAVVRR